MRFRTSLLALVLVAGLPVAAQSATFGIAAGLATPGGDMTNSVGSDMTLGLGIQVRVKFGAGHAILPRLDKVTFKGTTHVNGFDLRAESALTSFGVDYNWFTSRQAGEGFYLSTGLGYLQKEDKVEGGSSSYYTVSGNQQKDRIYFSLGLGGVIAKHVDLSARLQFFGDERQADTYNSNSGQYQANYSMSTVFTLGVAYHF